MNPLLLLSLAQAGSAIGSAFTNQQVMPTNVNPFTQQFMEDLQARIAQLEGQLATERGGIQRTAAQQERTAQTAEQLAQQAGDLERGQEEGACDELAAQRVQFQEPSSLLSAQREHQVQYAQQDQKDDVPYHHGDALAGAVDLAPAGLAVRVVAEKASQGDHRQPHGQ